ncbi:DUF6932 family protein [Bradyrhizobium oligotrophicum]|uniref:DUF6932 family protein n=1 Tax=Bradyrhizobium oligotrophicum TaxID=44255 RepID=UPI003EBED213
MAAHKFDYPPLLAPGRHFMTLSGIEALCVHPFTGQARKRREKLFYALDELVQELLRVKLPCTAFVDGSFLTEKPDPSDVDVLINIDEDVMKNLSVDQRILIDALNMEPYIAFIDSLAVTTYHRGHPYFGTALDVGNAGDAYGLEHAGVWLKGIAVLRFGETDVGLRICR